MSERREPPRWSLATRIAFRFLFSYLTLYFLLPALASSNGFLLERYIDFWDAVVVWADEAVVHLPYELAFDERGISSSPYGWVQFLCAVALACAATAVWSVLDRRRLHYARLYPWLRLALRYMLAGAMIRYGAIKVIPSQMIAPPPLGALARRIGDLFPNHLLWWTVGASPPFERATGLAEMLGGALLLLPRTTLLGAVISTANLLLVFLLNMCYDVPVKLPSLHLLVMAALLAAPDLPRLADVFLFNRRAQPSRVQPLFQRKWFDRIPHILLFLFGLYAIKADLELSVERHKKLYPPRSPLYGLWSVEVFSRDGKDVPLFTEPDRWRLVLLQAPGSLQVEQMAGSRKGYELHLDMRTKRMTLGPAQGTFSFHQPEKDLLVLDGLLEGHPIRAKLRKAPLIRRTT
ncbi:MAG TPA: hypothetical protein VEW48_14535 [Thermoanaerobaculia bacterium]|nr:hypothetical protein [Thermoanaerobaculia bacterium]